MTIPTEPGFYMDQYGEEVYHLNAKGVWRMWKGEANVATQVGKVYMNNKAKHGLFPAIPQSFFIGEMSQGLEEEEPEDPFMRMVYGKPPLRPPIPKRAI